MDHASQAALYRAALLLGLMRGEDVIAWADAVIASDAAAPAACVEIATTPPGDLTALRERLFALCEGRESPATVHAHEQLKAFGVDVFLAPANSPARAEAEQRVRDWLAQHA